MVGSTSTDQSELKSWAMDETASRGSSSNTVPNLAEESATRMKRVSKEVRMSMSDYQMALFHPDLDVAKLLANINQYFDKAAGWPWPVGQNSALRIVIK